MWPWDQTPVPYKNHDVSCGCHRALVRLRYILSISTLLGALSKKDAYFAIFSAYNEIIRILSFLIAYHIYFITFIILNPLSQLHFYDKFLLTMKKNFQNVLFGLLVVVWYFACRFVRALYFTFLNCTLFSDFNVT